jgi:diphthine synthase
LGKLTFVGLGLGDQGVTVGGIKAIREADTAYLEYYTTPYAPRLLQEVEGAAQRTMTIVDRTFVEDGKKILDEARSGTVVLAVQGDPMIATTHSDLMVRAISRGIKTEIVHAATIATAAASASGLHYYKFGATVTFTRESKNFHEQVYKRVHQNLLEGSHTLLLLEYDVEGGHGVTPHALMEGLLRAEGNYKREVVSEKTFLVVLSRVGTQQESLRTGTIADLMSLDYGQPPHVAIVPGRLHFSEKEALSAVTGIDQKQIGDNTETIHRTAEVLVPRYVEKAKKALEAGKSSLKEGYEQVFENAELYMKDAERFLAEGQDELAMLSIGYAEGLIDSLTFSGKLKLEW